MPHYTCEARRKFNRETPNVLFLKRCIFAFVSLLYTSYCPHVSNPCVQEVTLQGHTSVFSWNPFLDGLKSTLLSEFVKLVTETLKGRKIVQ